MILIIIVIKVIIIMIVIIVSQRAAHCQLAGTSGGGGVGGLTRLAPQGRDLHRRARESQQQLSAWIVVDIPIALHNT